MNSAAGLKGLLFRERCELEPVPVRPAGSRFPLFPSLKRLILSRTLALCVVDHAINPIT